MSLIACILSVAATFLWTVSGASLILYHAEIPLEVGTPLELDCGVQGHPSLCFWEREDGRVLQVEDVHAGRHEGLRAPHNQTDNQCGIVLDAASEDDHGTWTCWVLLPGAVLKGVTNVGKGTKMCKDSFVAIGNGCFHFNQELYSWHDASTFCSSICSTGDLAVLKDCHQHQLVWNYILTHYGAGRYWIGGTNGNQEGSWHWVDGSPVAMGTPFWKPNEPSGDGKCLNLLERYGYFNDANYTRLAGLICQDLFSKPSQPHSIGDELQSHLGTSLIFENSDIPMQVGTPLELDCGVQGHPRQCFWERKDGHVLQVEDVHAGRHEGLRAPHNQTDNQCGIVLDAASEEDRGAWTCWVLLPGIVLKGVTNVGKGTKMCKDSFVAIGDGCYYFSGQAALTWEGARTFCQELGHTSDLVVLNDCHQFQLVWNYNLVHFGTTWHWIGGTDRYQEGSWHWVDGSPVAMGTPFWIPGEPQGDGNCLQMSSPYGYFNDDTCNATGYFICQDLYTEPS